MHAIPRRIAVVCALAGLLTLLFRSNSPAAASTDLMLASVRQSADIYTGPGSTYDKEGTLKQDVEVTVLERNRIGNWLHIEQTSESGSKGDGWVMTGMMKLNPDLRFSTLAVNETLPDADLDNAPSAKIARLYAEPIIPAISDDLRAVYERGQTLGIKSRVVTKIGDSLTADAMYLSILSAKGHVLGPYDQLADTLAYFGPSTPPESVAAQPGLSSAGVFDPFRAPKYCKPNEAPLDCEYRRNRPSVVFILLGLNDIPLVSVEDYTTNVRDLITESMKKGIIPVLSTFSYDPIKPHWDMAIDYNLSLLDLAHEYHIPIINLWLAVQPLPEYGLDGDGIHMRHDGFRMLRLDRGGEAWAGVLLRNLLTLETLDNLRRAIPME